VESNPFRYFPGGKIDVDNSRDIFQEKTGGYRNKSNDIKNTRGKIYKEKVFF